MCNFSIVQKQVDLEEVGVGVHYIIIPFISTAAVQVCSQTTIHDDRHHQTPLNTELGSYVSHVELQN